MSADRVTDYDRIAGSYDTRYGVYPYDGVRDTLLNFLGTDARRVLEVGCGTGHWLDVTRLTPSPDTGERRETASAERFVVGLDPSAAMLARARAKSPSARLVRGRAEVLPWGDATFDRIYCINALHHFADRNAFFAEARRILRPGGGLLTIGKDPHTDHDDWWVYTYFEETREIDRARYARVRTLRGEMALAGFAWTESMEADRIEVVQPARDALAAGVVDRSFTSQLTVLSPAEFAAGLEKMRQANEAAGGELQLIADFRLYATVGWLA